MRKRNNIKGEAIIQARKPRPKLLPNSNEIDKKTKRRITWVCLLNSSPSTDYQKRQILKSVPAFTGFEIKRTDDDISASRVRNAITIDDEATFKKMTPKSIHNFYKTLQDTLTPIQEKNKNENLCI